MADEDKPGLVALRDRREAVIQKLSDAYAEDLLDDATFEERIALVHQATDVAALDGLVKDVVSTSLVPVPKQVGLVPAKRRMLALFSSVERSGAYALPESLEARAIFGSAVIDLRDAQLEPGVTTLSVRAIFGNVEIIVPPELAVACDGTAIFASFEHKGQSAFAEAGKPCLRIDGTAIFGNVEVKVRPRRGKSKASELIGRVLQKLLPAPPE
jgi:hypothetical protein